MKRYPPDESGQAPLAGAGGGQSKRQNKEKTLKEAGYEVIRFTDKQVLTDIQKVIAEIENSIEEFEKQDVGKFTKFNPQPSR